MGHGAVNLPSSTQVPGAEDLGKVAAIAKYPKILNAWCV
jgi:hypothetical protein